MSLLRRCLKHLILSISYITVLHFAYTQNDIEGIVQDNQGEPLAFANVLLLYANDSTLAKGTITEETGQFLLKSIPSGRYILSVSMVGFKSISTEQFDFGGNSKMTLPVISLLEGVALEEVVVTSKKNLYVQKIDRMVINVASSILSVGASALEVLERSPGVLVDRQNSAISLIGKSGVVVIINGKQSYMPSTSLVQMLEGMSSDNIETIELITTPPANFDAEGNAGFINIVLKERTDFGLNGSYSLSAGIGNGSTTSDNINLNYRKNKLNFFGSYSFLRDAQGQLFTFNRLFLDERNIPITIATQSDRNPIQRNHNIRTGIDYQASDKTIFGLLLWANDNKWTMDAINQSQESENGLPDSFVELLTSERNQLRHFGSNLNFKHDLKKDSYVSFDLDHLIYRLKNPTVYTNSFFDGNNNFIREELTTSDKTTPISITVAKSDYSTKVNEKVKFEFGVKGAFSNFDNDVTVGTFQGQNLVKDTELTDFSSLKERILAGYCSMDYTLSDKTSLQLGLRYEHTDSELVSEKQGKVVDREFGELFPTAYISHKVNDTLGMNFSYSRRITRPTFNDLAPFVIFVDPTTFFAGNPAVQPAISNSIKFDINYKSVIFSAQYSSENGTISRFNSRFDQENERLIFGAANMDKTETISLTFGLPITFTNWWKMQNNLMYLKTKVTNTVEGSLFALEQNTFNINSTQSFTMAKNFTSEINVNYNSPSIISFIGTAILEEFYGINIGIQKKFGERGGTLGFRVNDLLNSVEWKVVTDIPEQNLNTVNTFDFSNRTFLLTYSNSFGNRKLKSARERGTGAEEEKLRIN